jgi:hypothetical protein
MDEEEETVQNVPARRKLLNTVGIVGKVSFQIINNEPGYTGIFDSGADYGIIRFSTFVKPVEIGATEQLGYGTYTPAMALKFLRNNVPAGNIFGMYSIDSKDSWNFFRKGLEDKESLPVQKFT